MVRVYDIDSSGTEFVTHQFGFPTNALVALHGGTSALRELYLNDLLLYESRRRLRALSSLPGDRSSRSRVRRNNSERSPRVRASYEGLLPVFVVDDLVDRRAFVGDLLGFDQDLASLFSKNLTVCCRDCKLPLVDGSPNCFDAQIHLPARLGVSPESDLSAKSYIFARFSVPPDLSNIERVSRVRSLLRYAVRHGYSRAAFREGSQIKGDTSFPKLHKFTIEDIDGGGLDQQIASVAVIDLLIDSCRKEHLSRERLASGYQRLVTLGCEVGVVSSVRKSVDDNSTVETHKFGPFFYCPSCDRVISRRHGEEACSIHSLSLRSAANYGRVRAWFGSEPIDCLLDLPFREWLPWLDATGSAYRPCESEQERAYHRLRHKLEGVGKLGIGQLTYRRRGDTLSSGEFLKVALLAITHRSTCDAILVLEEPSRYFYPSEYGNVQEQFKGMAQRGLTLIVGEQVNALGPSADWVLELASNEAGGRTLNSVVYQGPQRVTQMRDHSIDSSQISRWPHVDASDLDRMLDDGLPHKSIAICGRSGSGKTSFLHRAVTRAERGELKGVDGYPFKHGHFLTWEGEGMTVSSSSLLVDVIGLRDEIATQFFNATKQSQSLSLDHFKPFTNHSLCPDCGGRTLPDEFAHLVEVCPFCRGTRFDPALEAVRLSGNSVSEVYTKPLRDVMSAFASSRKIVARLRPLVLIGLGHLSLVTETFQMSRVEFVLSQLARNLLQGRNERQLFALDQVFCGMELSTIELCLKQLARLSHGRCSVIIATNDDNLGKFVDARFCLV